MYSNGKVILESGQMELTIKRLALELCERHHRFENTCLIGLQRTGVPMMGRIFDELTSIQGELNLRRGKLDVTFYRDDFRRGKPLAAQPTEIDFVIEGKNVVLIDDVLYTGRTIRAALDALLHYGRPEKVELLTLIDRRLTRDLPIKADYVGMTVDTLDESYVKVEWGGDKLSDKVWLFPKREDE